MTTKNNPEQCWPSEAKLIAERFFFSSYNFLDIEDIHISDVCLNAMASMDCWHGSNTIYHMFDGSMLIVTPSFWDILTRRIGEQGLGLYDENGALYVHIQDDGSMKWNDDITNPAGVKT
jgi:hypothetical protein|tara:strand:+ start:2323 stop:2679 length:357 start_codon:yes stop_codon:yes gene_type:complete